MLSGCSTFSGVSRVQWRMRKRYRGTDIPCSPGVFSFVCSQTFSGCSAVSGVSDVQWRCEQVTGARTFLVLWVFFLCVFSNVL